MLFTSESTFIPIQNILLPLYMHMEPCTRKENFYQQEIKKLKKKKKKY